MNSIALHQRARERILIRELWAVSKKANSFSSIGLVYYLLLLLLLIRFISFDGTGKNQNWQQYQFDWNWNCHCEINCIWSSTLFHSLFESWNERIYIICIRSIVFISAHFTFFHRILMKNGFISLSLVGRYSFFLAMEKDLA